MCAESSRVTTSHVTYTVTVMSNVARSTHHHSRVTDSVRVLSNTVTDMSLTL